MKVARPHGGRRSGAGRPRGEETKVVRLPVPVADLAQRLADRGIRAMLYGVRRVRYKTAGVVCLDIHPAERVPTTLFHTVDSAERQALMTSLDALNQRFGRGR